MILAAFLLTVTTPAAQAPDQRAILDVFRAACGRADNLDHMKADARSGGWEEMAADSDPRVQRLLRTGRQAIGAGWTLDGAAFRKMVGGTPLFLIVSRADDGEGLWGSGCRLYDFDAAEPIASSLIEGWMGRPPTGRQNLPGAGSKLLWEPGWRDGVTVEINHVPQDSPIREQYGLSGNILVAQAFGGF